MPVIREAIVSTMNASGQVHFAPIGLIAEGDGWIIAPFYPSTTLSNLRSVPFAAANFTDDVRVFAGCLTGRSQWPIATCEAAISLSRLVHDCARTIPRFQSRTSGCDRSSNPCQPATFAAARKDRKRDGLLAERSKQNRLKRRGRGMELAGRCRESVL